MATISDAFVPLALFGLLLDSASSTDLMRRHSSRSAFSVGPDGELFRERSEAVHEAGDRCNFNFVFGIKDTNNCTIEEHTLIEDATLCMTAAAEGKFTTDASNFYLDRDWFDKRPRGCFVEPCDANPKGCVFFNTEKEYPSHWPSHPEGLPICSRQQFRRGKWNTNGGCLPHYNPINSSDMCYGAGVCLGACEGDIFNVQEHGHPDRDSFPQGCSIHPVDGCVYWNPTHSAPKTPHGRPICKTQDSFANNTEAPDFNHGASWAPKF